MCFDPVHNIGFVANNAENPPFITAVNARTHTIIGKIIFNGTPQNGGGIGVNATNGIEQCQFNPRDNNIYVSVPEVGGPGDNSFPGAVARINPVTMQILAAPLIPIAACSGPQGLAIGPVVGTFGQMLTGCNGAVANASATRPTALVDDGTAGGTFGAVVALPFQTGNDMVTFNGIVTGALTAPGFTNGDGHFYLARSGNNSNVNPSPLPDGRTPVCPTVAGSTLPNGVYGEEFYVTANTLGFTPQFNNAGSKGFAGPQVLGMVNATTLENDPETPTGLFSCTAPFANPHGGNHSVAADPIHNQIYVPIASTAWGTNATGVCAAGGGVDANGCIAVYGTTGTDP